MQTEIYLVQGEYLDKHNGFTQVCPCGWSNNYELAKQRCHEVVEEDEQEGEYPIKENGSWNPNYDDQFVYEDDNKRVIVYVCTVDEI